MSGYLRKKFAWWKNVSIAKKLYFVVGVMTVLIVCELAALQFAMHTLSATRAFVGGEGLWSKAQKNSDIYLLRYGITRNEKDYQLFIQSLKVPEGDHKARVELFKPSPDISKVREGFLQGNIHPEDIDPMIELLRRFYWVSYLSRAIEIWGQADGLLIQFKDAGLAYHQALMMNDHERSQAALQKVKDLNAELTSVENDFSYVLGVGSRWVEHIVLTILSVAVLIVESIGLTLTFLTSRAISRGLGALNRLAKRMGRGDFSEPITPSSNDEIGQLTMSVNLMGQLISKSYGELEGQVKKGSQELAQSKEQLSVVLNGITDGITVIDDRGRFVYANEAGALMSGFSSVKEFLETPQNKFCDYFSLLDENGKIFPWDKLPSKRLFNGELNPPEVILRTLSKKDNLERWTMVKSAPVYGENGKVKLVVTISRDFTERKRSEDAVKFLDEASRALVSSLDYEKTLQNLAHLAVPRFADWCSIAVIEKVGTPPRSIALAHADPKKLEWSKELSTKYPTDWSGDTGPAKVIKTGQAQWYPEISDEQLVRGAKDSEHLRLIRALGMRSIILVPLISRSRVFGVITLISAESGRKYSEHDFVFANELARRAASAIDNSLLYRQAQQAIQVREDFLSIASHELKTPITSLSLQIQMARQKIHLDKKEAPPPEKLAKIFDISNRQIERLTGLVEDLLDASSIQAGKFSFHFEKVDVSEIVNDMVSRFSDQFLKANMIVETDIQEKVLGFFDHGRMEQVLDNLLSNAIKYARGFPVKVSLKKVEKDKVQIIVEDHGPGIQRDKQDLVFERFERAAASNSVTGLGLGLFIVKEIIKGHGGVVRLESAAGQGSKFILDLPLKSEEKPTVKTKEIAPTYEA